MKIGMKLLILLLNSVLLFRDAITLHINLNSNLNYNLEVEKRLPDNIIPQYYDINLELHATYRDISSQNECKILIWIDTPTPNISLHVDMSQIHRLNLYLQHKSDALNFLFEPTGYTYDNENNILALFFRDAILSGYYTMKMNFMYTENSNIGGLFRTSFINEEGDRTWLVAMDFLPIGARRMFPCWDEPGFPAIFNVFIKYDKNYTILFNTESINITDGPNMMKTAHFKTNVIPTYLISAILLSHFSSFFMGDTYTWMIFEHRQQLQVKYITYACAVIEEIRRYFKLQEYFRNITKITHVVIPSFRHDAVSNLGLIYYRETAIIFDEEKDPFIRKIEIARLIGRTMAHQCLTNRINPSWWSYMWLIEGITTLLGMDAIDEAFPHFRIKDLFVVQTQQESLHLDNNFLMKPLVSEVKSSSDIESIFSMSYYIKAPAILRMLRHMITDKVFLMGINSFLSTEFALIKTTMVDAFWTAMQYNYETYEKPMDHPNLKHIMDSWMKQQHYPVVMVRQDGTLLTVIENTGANDTSWWIPYTFRNAHFSLANVTNHELLIFSSKTGDQLTLAATNVWNIINVQQIGYYRVNYHITFYQKIASCLNSDEYAKIHVLNRAQIIDDAFYFLMRNELRFSMFLELTRYLGQETDYIAWYPMIKALEYMSSFFPFPQSIHIKEHTIGILNKLLKEIKYETKDDPDDIGKSLKQEAAKWACILGSSECKKEANSKLQIHLKEENVLPWKEWTYCNGLMTAGNNTWDLVFRTYIEKPDYTGFKFLACSENFFIIRNYTELIASRRYNKTINYYGRIHIFHSVVARHAKNNTMLDYLLENFDKLKPREISATVALIDIINHVYSKEQLDKISHFMYNYAARPRSSLKHPLFDKSYVKIIPCLSSGLADLIFLAKILLFKRKTELRLSQIMQQEHYFQNFTIIH